MKSGKNTGIGIVVWIILGLLAVALTAGSDSTGKTCTQCGSKITGVVYQESGNKSHVICGKCYSNLKSLGLIS